MVSMWLAGLLGCTHLAVLDGAVPLAPGARMVTTELQVTRTPSPIGAVLPMPLPRVGVGIRRGLQPGRDFGVHLSAAGAAVDLRQRLGQLGPVDLAVAPTAGLFLLPGVIFNYAAFDLTLPLRAEVPLGEAWSLAGGPAVSGRQTGYSLLAGELTSAKVSFDAYVGGSVRVAWVHGRVTLGLGAAWFQDVVRTTGPYGGLSFGLGLTRPAGAGSATARSAAEFTKGPGARSVEDGL